MQITSTWFVSPDTVHMCFPLVPKPFQGVLIRSVLINHENTKISRDLQRFIVQLREENSYLAERIAEAQSFSPGELGAELALADLMQVAEQAHCFDIA